MISARHSVLLLDNAGDRSSFAAAKDAAVKLGLRKVGHTGTLDGNVTGLLLVAFEEATKGIPLLWGQDKEYAGVMRLESAVPHAQLRAAAAEFTGRITQVPPEKSRVRRVPRQRTVHLFEINPPGNDRTASFRCIVEAGTYVRTLLADLGERLGVPIEMAALRRTAIGPFRVEEAVTFERLTPRALLPLDDALLRLGIPRARITAEQEARIRKGLPLPHDGIEWIDAAASPAMLSLIGDRGVIVAVARRSHYGWHAFHVLAP